VPVGVGLDFPGVEASVQLDALQQAALHDDLRDGT
jgi:hypothetical protein